MFRRALHPRPSPSLALDTPSTSSAASESEVLFTKPFVLMLCVQFCFGLSYSTFFLLPKYLTREFHANASVIGAVAAIGLLAGVFATPLIGRVIDRGVRRPSITYGALVHGLSACAFAGLHAVAAPLYLLRVVNGVSYALVFNAVATLAADLAPPKKLGQAIGLCGAAGMAANAIAPGIAEIIADDRGWGLVFLLAGGAALFSALLSLGIREPRVARTTTQSASRAAVETIARADGAATARADGATTAKGEVTMRGEVAPSAWALARDPRRA